MNPLHIAANLKWLFSEWPLEERFRVAAACGFKAVELSLPYGLALPRLRHLLNSHALKFVYLLASPGDWDAGERGLAGVPGRTRDFQDGMRQAIEYACALGQPVIHPPAGTCADDVDPLECRLTLRHNLLWAATAAAEKNLRLVVEPICRRDHPRFPINTVAQGLALIQEVGAANIGLLVDFHHIQWEEGFSNDCVHAAIRRALPWMWHVQLALAPDRHGPDEVNFDVHAAIAEAGRLGYSGYFSCEYRPSPHTLGSLKWANRYGVEAVNF